jgi:hypothetical protein
MSGRVLLHVSMSLDGFTAGPKVCMAIDEIHVNVIPTLLGGGARLCEGLITPPIELERMSVAASSPATHIAYRVRTTRRHVCRTCRPDAAGHPCPARLRRRLGLLDEMKSGRPRRRRAARGGIRSTKERRS